MPDSQPDRELTAELEAMQAVGQALARVDPQTRRRILHWATERFATSAEPVVAIAQAAEQDPALSVDGVELFAEIAHDDIEDLTVPVAAVSVREVEDTSDDQSLDSLLRAFAGDIRRLAALWQGA